MTDAPQIMTRAEAKARGLKRYFTGKSCPHGHVSERTVIDGSCVSCGYVTSAAWKARNTEKVKDYTTAWHARNVEKEKADRVAYCALNREKVKAQQKASHTKHAEKVKANLAAWRAQNPEKIKAYREVWVQNNYDKVLTNNRNRRAQIRNAEGSHTKEDIQRIHTAQGGKCACCKEKVGKKYHVDHIQPLTKGGSNAARNLQILCPPCNNRKYNHDPLVHMQSLGFLL